ncbi:MAG: calcium/sodium antiporter [Alphaproteobacteria bacterium]|nr:calcium/sodium antiporter [Alphaproteobacteria bacterium]
MSLTKYVRREYCIQMIDAALIIAGLVLLFLGGEALVRGSVTISKKLGISAILIGVVVVGFGTSAPELLVSVKASLNDQPDIALGNVIGSNIANILLILGAAAVITPVLCYDKTIKRDAFSVVLASVAFLVLAYMGTITQLAGGIMVTALVAYLAYSYMSERKDKALLAAAHESAPDIETTHEHEADEFAGNFGLPLSIAMTIGGIVMLVFGADFLVRGATSVARSFGVSEAVIGLTLVALGTSLPELATAIAAAVKKNTDVIIGNVLGSNLFNILSILGITALIQPIPVNKDLVTFDVPFALALSVLTLLVIVVFKKINRVVGALFLLAYAAYMAWLFISGHV